MQDPYFRRPAPKSLDRNHFHALAADAEALSDADGAATLAAFMHRGDGGGARAGSRGPAPLAGLRRRPRKTGADGGPCAPRLGVAVEPIEAIGQDGDFVEAACFAHLALRSRRGLPLSLPTTTGAPVADDRRRVLSGHKKRPRRSGAEQNAEGDGRSPL